MEPLLRDSLADAGEIAQPEPVASLVVGSASPHRTLLHLGKLENGARYAVGIPGSNGVLWHLVGALDLTAIPVDRALLAGVSAMAMRHVREAQIQIGDAVLVFGTDPWALLLAQWALRQGASPLVFAGRVPESLSATLASVQVDAHIQNPTAGDLAKAVKGTHRSAGFATVIDAVASEQSMTLGLSALRDGGRYMPAGTDPQPRVLLNAYPDLHRRDLEILAAQPWTVEEEFARNFMFSLDLVAKGSLRFDGLLEPIAGWRIV
jgi:threonine dehydrogenase-like Zn-dependent dehydrogenase